MIIPRNHVTLKYFNQKPWLLIFFHNITKESDYFSDDENEFLYVVERQKFSIFKYINGDFNYHGYYEFLIEYPALEGYNQWKQSVFPLDANENNNENVGFKEDESILTWPNLFKGLIRSSVTEKSILDGITNNQYWWFTIGAKGNHGTNPLFFPGPSTSADGFYGIDLQAVLLWIFVPPHVLNNIFHLTYNIKRLISFPFLVQIIIFSILTK